MTNHPSHSEIEDVLSSIRRLVSEDGRAPLRSERAKPVASPDALVLTPQQRVIDGSAERSDPVDDADDMPDERREASAEAPPAPAPFDFDDDPDPALEFVTPRRPKQPLRSLRDEVSAPEAETPRHTDRTAANDRADHVAFKADSFDLRALVEREVAAALAPAQYEEGEDEDGTDAAAGQPAADTAREPVRNSRAPSRLSLRPADADADDDPDAETDSDDAGPAVMPPLRLGRAQSVAPVPDAPRDEAAEAEDPAPEDTGADAHTTPDAAIAAESVDDRDDDDDPRDVRIEDVVEAAARDVAAAATDHAPERSAEMDDDGAAASERDLAGVTEPDVLNASGPVADGAPEAAQPATDAPASDVRPVPFSIRRAAEAQDRAKPTLSLEDKISELEAMIAQADADWEPTPRAPRRAPEERGVTVPGPWPERLEPQETRPATTTSPDVPALPLDADALREVVADIVRQELQGMLGERITRNVRKLVRREINRALAGYDAD
ncbi:hypothetical protein ROJ8625_04032 [Roseivivax jejudonensis]|uniref:DUF2497 domain-containing protein n=1 Tax=Roseivivax jejudonensis TaxID=1529041 RepID=A0A1X7AAD1_9RHOB|nr:hypothetical protein [Roseivivax jejudonensis]SLN74278.1 hypothetical protein ROJ8625_04032 [Roseivivax jejudonensis]